MFDFFLDFVTLLRLFDYLDVRLYFPESVHIATEDLDVHLRLIVIYDQVEGLLLLCLLCCKILKHRDEARFTEQPRYPLLLRSVRLTTVTASEMDKMAFWLALIIIVDCFIFGVLDISQLFEHELLEV